MNYRISQGTFLCNDPTACTLRECYNNVATTEDGLANRACFVFFTNGKLSTDHVQRFIFGNAYHYCNEILIFSNGVTKEGERLLEHYKQYYPNMNFKFLKFQEA